MSRDGSGNYALPAGNPVSTGTLISSTWANATMPDIGTALTNSIAKDGQTTPTANLPMGGNRHTGVSDGTLGTQYASINQVQNASLTKVGSVANATDAYTGSLAPVIAAYTDGLLVTLTPSATNTTTTVTLALNGLTVKPIQKEGGVALAIGDMVLNVPVHLQYTTQSSGYFMLLNPQVITSARLTAIADSKLSANIPLLNGANVFGPTAGISITINGVANTLCQLTTGSSTAGQSFGQLIRAGTTSADYAIRVQNQAGTLDRLLMRGDGVLSLGNTTDNAAVNLQGTGLITASGQIKSTVSNNGDTSGFFVSAVLPSFGVNVNGQPANGKSWDIAYASTQMLIRIINDAQTVVKSVMTATRSANVVTDIQFGNATDNNTASFQGSGGLKFGDEAGTQQDAGFRGLPQSAQVVGYTCVMADRGKHIYVTGPAGNVTIPSNASVAYPIGTTLTFCNDAAASINIVITSDTLVFSANNTTGTRALAVGGMATALKVTATRWFINGGGLS